MKYYIKLFVVLLMLTGCSYKDETKKKSVHQKTTQEQTNMNSYKTKNSYKNLDLAIGSIADQLFNTNILTKNTDIILTSFVDLNQLNKTTTFGRLISESMFNELHIRQFNVTDFRGQDAVSVNADGEFHITRDVEKLKDHIEAIEYILVGTYVKFENESVLVNARILDSEKGKVISTAKVVYKPSDCSLFDICLKNDGINIVTDNCSKVNCPTQQCKDGICDNSSLY